MYVADTLFGDKTGDQAKACAVGARVQVQAECKEVAREARHCAGKVQDGGIRARMLLARASGVQDVCGAEDKRGVLGEESGGQQGERPAGLEKAGGAGMVCDYSVGVRAGSRKDRADSRKGYR